MEELLKIFSIISENTVTLLIFILLGYWLKKSGKVTANFSKGLSVALVNVFSPLLSLKTFTNNFKAETLTNNFKLIGVSIIFLIVSLIIGFLFAQVFSRSKGIKDKNKFDIYLYSMTIPNLGYFGYPIIEAIWGEQMLFSFMVFCIPFTVFIYSFGIYILNPNKVLSFRKLLNIPMLAMFLGMILGLLNVKFAGPIDNVVNTGSACMAPIAMMLTGVVFASNNLKSMIANAKVYIAYILKMVALPLLFMPIFKLMNLSIELTLSMVIILVLPAGLNSIVFPEAFGGDSKTGAQTCCVSTALCIITIPIMLTIYCNYLGIPLG